MQGILCGRAFRVFLALAAALGALGCPSSDRDAILTTGQKLYSQFKEELIIRHFFDDRRDGFFVDVGSYHWKNLSTTYYLEERLGWSGLAVDALEDFRPGYEENRSRTKFFSYIVTDHSGTIESFYAAGPVSSTEPTHVHDIEDWLEDEADPEHPSQSPVEEVRTFWEDREKAAQRGASKFAATEIKVPTITLTELLDQNGVDQIDFLSMDIEQGEPAALAGFDIERFRPELVCIEAFRPVQEQIADYFERHGYERIDEYLEHDSINWYFRPKP